MPAARKTQNYKLNSLRLIMVVRGDTDSSKGIACSVVQIQRAKDTTSLWTRAATTRSLHGDLIRKFTYWTLIFFLLECKIVFFKDLDNFLVNPDSSLDYTSRNRIGR